MWISHDGWLAFEEVKERDVPSGAFRIPTTHQPNSAVYAAVEDRAWTDRSVGTDVVTRDGLRGFLVEWYLSDGTDFDDFEVVLWEDGNIDLHYYLMAPGRPLIGLERSARRSWMVVSDRNAFESHWGAESMRFEPTG